MSSSPATIQAVTVYCAASEQIDPAYLTAAFDLGVAVAQKGWTLIYGGNRVGCMLRVADGARSVGGRVVGITPQLFVDRGYHDTAASELIVTPDMRRRKHLLEERADAFIALPGGLGTYEELFEQLVNRQLQYHAKPLVAFNISGYFNPLRAMIQHGVRLKFIKPASEHLVQYADTVDAAIHLVEQPVVPTAPFSHELAGGH